MAASLFEAEELAHVAVVLLLAALRAEVQPQLVDDLDAVVAQPTLPAVGADVLVDAPADLVVHRRRRELTGVGAGDAHHALAAEAAHPGRPARGPRAALRRRRRLTQLDEHPRHLVARHVVAALVGHLETLFQ